MNTQRIYVRGLESSTLNVSLDGAKQGKNMFQHFGNELGVNPDLLKTEATAVTPVRYKAVRLLMAWRIIGVFTPISLA